MIFLSNLLSFCLLAGALDTKELQKWRDTRETRLKAEDGWLTVVGLDWLKKGENTVGSAFGSDVRLPAGGPKALGKIIRNARKASIVFAYTDGVKLDGKAVKAEKAYSLSTDAEDQYTLVTYDDVKFYVIDRKNGIGVRIKHQNSKARKKFKGLDWYKAVPEMQIKAKWVAYEKPKTLMVPDILGNVNEELAYGYAEFDYNGETHRLYPSGGPDKLFFVFKDKTNGIETYKAPRFLYSEGPKDGYVNLDFNKAYNPPCAFTDFATCPRAPKENILKVAIRAGEKKPL